MRALWFVPFARLLHVRIVVDDRSYDNTYLPGSMYTGKVNQRMLLR
jgi:hypothetical protein